MWGQNVSMAVRVRPIAVTDARAARLLDAARTESDRLYPPQDNHGIDPGAPPAALRLFGATDGLRLLGIAGLLPRDGYAEVKAMFVVDTARGRGVGAALLAEIERAAATSGLRVLRLETGAASVAACRLYARAGFAPCGPFGSYRAGGSSIFMERRLGR